MCVDAARLLPGFASLNPGYESCSRRRRRGSAGSASSLCSAHRRLASTSDLQRICNYAGAAILRRDGLRFGRRARRKLCEPTHCTDGIRCPPGAPRRIPFRHRGNGKGPQEQKVRGGRGARYKVPSLITAPEDTPMRFSSSIRAALIAGAAIAGLAASSAARADEGYIEFSVLKAGWFIGGSEAATARSNSTAAAIRSASAASRAVWCSAHRRRISAAACTASTAHATCRAATSRAALAPRSASARRASTCYAQRERRRAAAGRPPGRPAGQRGSPAGSASSVAELPVIGSISGTQVGQAPTCVRLTHPVILRRAAQPRLEG